jgi:hypothetical protein
MNILRFIFGIIYLGGAIANITLTALNSPQSYYSFADAALIPFYRQAWEILVIPNILLFIVLLIIFELFLGLLFITRRRLLKIALALGAIFCLGTVPFSLQVLSTNLPLGIIQLVLLFIKLRKPQTSESP